MAAISKKCIKKCDKCHCKNNHIALMIHGGIQYNLCYLCTSIVESNGTNCIIDFMHFDGSDNKEIKMSQIQKDMLKARERRNSGKFLF